MTRILLVTLCLLPTPLLAHGLHDSGTFLAGAMHPVGGLDHVLAMLAVGLLAAQMAGRALWALPLAFVAAMLAGGAMGAAGLPFPAVEPMILASIVILGALVALALRLPLTVTLALTAVFGLAHGWAHGAEGPAAGLALYAAGFAGATAGLHLAGIALGRGLSAPLLRGLGAVAASGGLALAFV
jgi:urease accessory protein